MRGAVGLFEFVLIALVVVAIIAFIYPWASKMMKEAFDAAEVSAMQNQFKDCNLKILETARTGTKNKCLFSISQGELTGTNLGIEYNLDTESPICEQHTLMIIDEESHIYQSCIVSGDYKNFKMVWRFPESVLVEGTGLQGTQMKGDSPVGTITFGDDVVFITLTLQVNFDYGEGGTGNTVELERKSIDSDKVELSVNIY